jgi:branched-chain amino acid transport system substrate-binding protein
VSKVFLSIMGVIAALERNPRRSGMQKALSSSNFSIIGASGAIRFGDRNTPVQLLKIVPGSRSRTGYYFEPVR